MKKVAGFGAAGLVSCLVLSGCSDAPRIAGDRAPSPAPTVDIVAQRTAQGAEGITITWPLDSASIIITSLGSSSCPLVPLRVEGDQRNVVVLDRDTGGSDVCTADISPTSSTIARPATWAPGTAIRATYRDNEVLLVPE